jgi:hypothetical protein
MGSVMGRSWSFAAVLLLALTGCGREGTVYAVAPDEARRDLVGTNIPDMAFGMSAHAEPAVATADGVEWHVVRGEDGSGLPDGGPTHEIMVLSATLAPSGESTLVTIAIRPAAGVDKTVFDKNMSDNPAVADMFRAIASEAVDAGLAHRRFEFANISAQIATATISLLPQISQQMDDAAREFEKRDQDTMDEAYRRDRR